MERIFLTEREVSERYGFALQTLRNWRSRNIRLPYYKYGRKVLYKDLEILAFIEDGKVDVSKTD